MASLKQGFDKAPVVADAPVIAPGEERLREALEEARLQLEYLDGRWPTGTTPAVLARMADALNIHPMREDPA